MKGRTKIERWSTGEKHKSLYSGGRTSRAGIHSKMKETKIKHPCVPRKALFLDRDGVINVEKNYVHTIEEFEFKEGIFSLCRAAASRGMRLIIVTNQAGIGRGLYKEEAFWKLTSWMEEQFINQNAPIEKVYHCPFHPEYGIGEYRQNSIDRKPNPGMILRARDELGIDLANSVMIGDKESDMLAAAAAGIGKKVLLAKNDGAGVAADAVCQSLVDIQALLFPRMDLSGIGDSL